MIVKQTLGMYVRRFAKPGAILIHARHSRAFSSKTSDFEQVYVAVYMLALECKGNRSNMLGGRFASFL